MVGVEDIEARTPPHARGGAVTTIRVAGAAVRGRVKRSRGRGALAGAKTPGAHEPDAFDEATGERGPRRDGSETSRRATMVSEASPPIAKRG